MPKDSCRPAWQPVDLVSRTRSRPVRLREPWDSARRLIVRSAKRFQSTVCWTVVLV
ncbi:hypothetical protein RISK_002763 [Rhodopirellula islandica]|uniref:Uncharacterized protein n=1 Tax=Rhodopirellula islandica TaxID=595434 RepID=A0A0J1BFC5_RHOIS|nr:hypothetical protein RISK_002763 [Rhodopirellula islandica]